MKPLAEHKACSWPGACIKRQRFEDHDGRDTLCLHSHGADEAAVQTLVRGIAGYRATRCFCDAYGPGMRAC